jgi:MFS family permease
MKFGLVSFPGAGGDSMFPRQPALATSSRSRTRLDMELFRVRRESDHGNLSDPFRQRNNTGAARLVTGAFMTAPAQRYYYGWINVILAAAVMSATLPGRTYGLGLIKEPLRNELGITDLRFNVLNFWAIVIGSLTVPIAGRLIDAIGTRRTLGLVAGLLGIAVLAMARVRDEWPLAVAMTFVRGLGQGALSIVAIALVGKWFRRRAALAMAIFTVLLSFGFSIPMFAVGELVKQYGWRAAWDAVGYSLLLGLVPLGLLLARSSPESMGVAPDEPDLKEGQHAAVRLRDAVRTRAFWIISMAAVVFNFAFSAVTLDNEQLLIEHGLSRENANTTILAILMVSGIPANLAAGIAARWFGLGRILAVGMLLFAMSLALFPFVRSMEMASLDATLLGASGGVITVVYFAAYGHRYGRAHLGDIVSVVQILTVLSSAIGPVALAWIRDRQNGSTTLFFLGMAPVALMLAIAAATIRKTESTA